MVQPFRRSPHSFFHPSGTRHMPRQIRALWGRRRQSVGRQIIAPLVLARFGVAVATVAAPLDWMMLARGRQFQQYCDIRMTGDRCMRAILPLLFLIILGAAARAEQATIYGATAGPLTPPVRAHFFRPEPGLFATQSAGTSAGMGRRGTPSIHSAHGTIASRTLRRWPAPPSCRSVMIVGMGRIGIACLPVIQWDLLRVL